MINYVKHPVAEEISKDYIIKCNGIAMEPYHVRVSAMPYNTVWPGRQRPLDQTELASVVNFEADEKVELEVEVAWDFEEAVVRPLSKNITVEKCGRICKFTLETCGQYTLEIDGFHKALHIFVDPVMNFEAKTENVIRYEAGIHYGDIEIDSNTTVILDRGAILYGNITAYGKENVSIIGYGMIDGSCEKRYDDTLLIPLRLNAFDGPLPTDKADFDAFMAKEKVLKGNVRFLRCKNCTLKGVTLRDSSTFSVVPADCDNVLIDGVKIIGMWRYNSDGIDVFNSSNVWIKNSFLRDFDDCVVIKGIKGWDTRNLENILVENCVVWCDWGRNLEVGAETNAPEFKNIVFRNCDCIHGSYCMLDIQHHDRADVHHVTFEDIRCEYTKYQLSDVYQSDMNAPYPNPQPAKHPLLIELPIHGFGGFGYGDMRIGTMHDIIFKNITVYADDPEVIKSRFAGWDEVHCIKRVLVSNVTVNGEKVTPKIEICNFVSDVVIE